MTTKEILIVLAIALIIISSIIWSARSNKKTKPSQPKDQSPPEDPWDHLSSEKKQAEGKILREMKLRLNRNDNWEEYPEIGNYANAWLKPDTDTILFYEGGAVGGYPIGWIEDREIADHLRKEGVTSATILSCDKRYCTIEFTMHDMYEPEIREQREQNFKEKLLKPYKPKKDWDLMFNMSADFDPSAEVHLKRLSSDEVLNDNESIHKSIWVEDNEGNRLSEPGYFEHDKLIRTLRAFYSGLDVKIKKVEKTGDQYKFTIGL